MTRRSRVLLATALLAGSMIVLAPSPAYAGRCPSFTSPVRSGTITDNAINEASGIVATGPFKKTFWLEEDSGNGEWLYAVSTRGRIRATIAVRNASNWDWEDIARASHRVWLGDIGANQLSREFIRVYWFKEPRSLSTDHVDAKVAILRYPGNVSHNAEAMLVSGSSRRVFIFEKQTSTSSSRVFGASLRNIHSGDNVRLKLVARVPMQNITAADLGRSGIVVKNYSSGLFFPWRQHRVIPTLEQASPCAVSLPSGEAVAFSKAGGRLYTVGEGSNPPIEYVARR